MQSGPPQVTVVYGPVKVTAVAWADELSSDGSRWYMALDPRLHGCLTDGKTIDEAVSNLNELRPEYIRLLIEEGVTLPDGVDAKEAL